MSDQKIRIAFDTAAPKGIAATAAAARSAEKDVKKYTKAVAESVRTGGTANKMQTAALNESLKRAENLKASLEDQKKNEKLWGIDGHGLHQLQRMEQKFSRLFGEGSLANKLMTGKEIGVKDVLHAAISSEKLAAGVAKALSISPAAMAKVAMYGHVALKVFEQFDEKSKFHKEQEHEQSIFDLKLEKGLASNAEAQLRTEALESLRGRWMFLLNQDIQKEVQGKNRELAKTFGEFSGREIDQTFKKVQLMKGGMDEATAEKLSKTGDGIAWIKNGKKEITGEIYKRMVSEAQNRKRQQTHHFLTPAQEEQINIDVLSQMKIDPASQEALASNAEKIRLQKIVELTPSQEYQKKQQESVWRMAMDDYQKRVPANPTD